MLIALSVTIIVATDWNSAILAVVPALAGAVLATRGYRMGVTIQPDRVTVRGLLLTRTIPRQNLLGLTDFPALRWRSQSGRMRWTPLTAFASNSRTLGRYRSHNATSLARLARTLRLP